MRAVRHALNISESPSADRERAFIRRRIAEGKTKAEIKRGAGRRVRRGRPRRRRRRGLRPRGLARARRAASLARRSPASPLTARRWRRRTARPRPPTPTGDLHPDDARRLEGTWRATTRDRARAAASRADTTVLAAFAVGFVSFISPVRAAARPGLPVGGLRRLDRRDPRGRAAARRGCCCPRVFCLSFTAVFVALGMTATGIGSTLNDHRGMLDKVAGALIIALGRLLPGHAVRARGSTASGVPTR